MVKVKLLFAFNFETVEICCSGRKDKDDKIKEEDFEPAKSKSKGSNKSGAKHQSSLAGLGSSLLSRISPRTVPKSKKAKLDPNHDHNLAGPSTSRDPKEHKGAKKGHLRRGQNSSVDSTTGAPNMDSSEEYDDSGNESSGEDVEFAMERDERGPTERSEDEYPFTVLSTEDIVQHMVDCIREVRTFSLSLTDLIN